MNAAPHTLSRTVLVDMDEVIAQYLIDLDVELLKADPGYPLVPHAKRLRYNELGGPGYNPDSLAAAINAPGLFRGLLPVPGALKALREMEAAGLNVLLVTTPTYGNATCVQDKYDWVNEHLGMDWVHRTIIAYDKTVVAGAVLIDDKPDITGSVTPAWTHLLFSAPYNRYVRDAVRMEGWENWAETVLPLLGTAAARDAGARTGEHRDTVS